MEFDRDKLRFTRKIYADRELKEQDLLAHPAEQFHSWFKLVFDHTRPETNAMTLATCGSSGHPSARVVLLKDYGKNGFIFFTNYNSKKGKELAENPYASLLFYWPDFDRQVRIEGVVTKVAKEISDEYFRARPKGSQLGAIVSPQSAVIKSRMELEERYKEAEAGNEDKEPERPGYWGGYILKPSYFEFWQGRLNRLHDRLIYRKEENELWITERLAP